jgi:hypothetical protein
MIRSGILEESDWMRHRSSFKRVEDYFARRRKPGTGLDPLSAVAKLSLIIPVISAVPPLLSRCYLAVISAVIPRKPEQFEALEQLWRKLMLKMPRARPLGRASTSSLRSASL